MNARSRQPWLNAIVLRGGSAICGDLLHPVGSNRVKSLFLPTASCVAVRKLEHEYNNGALADAKERLPNSGNESQTNFPNARARAELAEQCSDINKLHWNPGWNRYGTTGSFWCDWSRSFRSSSDHSSTVSYCEQTEVPLVPLVAVPGGNMNRVFETRNR
jgi:hypothetical protein